MILQVQIRGTGVYRSIGILNIVTGGEEEILRKGVCLCLILGAVVRRLQVQWWGGKNPLGERAILLVAGPAG